MIQIDDVRLMFTEIEQLRQNAWKELSPPEVGLSTVLRLTQPTPLPHWDSKRVAVAQYLNRTDG